MLGIGLDRDRSDLVLDLGEHLLKTSTKRPDIIDCKKLTMLRRNMFFDVMQYFNNKDDNDNDDFSGMMIAKSMEDILQFSFKRKTIIFFEDENTSVSKAA